MTVDHRRLQQLATRSAFFIPGFIIACWAPLVPFAKERASLDDATLGLLLLCLGLGSLAAMPISGVLAARYGCRPVMVATATIMVLALPMLAVVATPFAIGLVLLMFGAAIGGMDCVMNIQAIAVERESGRSMMSGFHAFYSIGGLAGAAGAALLLSLGAGIVTTTIIASLCAIAIALPSMRAWRSERAPRGEPVFALPRGVVILIGLVCFVSFLAEGAMLDWSAVFLHEVRSVDLSHAGWGFVAFNLAMTVVRLLGDGIVDRLGRARTVLVGGITASAGLLLVIGMADFGASLVGFALMGTGCANIVPVMFTYAGQQTSVPHSIAIPAVTTMGYAGVLMGPALIGFVAQQWSLSVAFFITAVFMAIIGFIGAAMKVR
ncbi:MAG TPA: MFS transporter [Povalibacter sp.]|uniref:MFS transporter n=1 Tax=Povalibacter sp. TaxID=1962978 RepID=UPI002CE51E27|nr:MFS transporter [Povalibacter sp.]HMN45991.1 MFS transporter [Povalibacter sp.]